MRTIFIPLAACQEYFLEHTIKSAIAMAEFPERIYFGIYNQISDKKYSLLNSELIMNNENIMYAEVIAKAPLGVGFARASASMLSTKEHDFIFQTDAHSIFTKNWDTLFIEAFDKIKIDQGTDNVVLSGMPGACFIYDKNNKDEIVMLSPSNENLPISIFTNNDFHKKDNVATHTITSDFNTNHAPNFPISTANSIPKKDYEEIYALHAAVMFAPYKIIRDVLHDPIDPYHGDQANYCIRLLSRGYRIFTVKHPTVISLGKVDRDGKIVDEEYHWKFMKGKYPFLSNYMIQSADINYKKIINGEYFGYWGAPNMQALKKAKNKMGFPHL